MPIKIPAEFRYKSRSSQKQYTRNPPGTPDVAALIANKPYWVSRTPMSVDKQKTLVLADWTVWSHEKKAQVKSSLIELMKEGFTLYRWSNGQVILLDENLSWMNDEYTRLRLMKAVSVQEITKAAVTQHKLTMDEIQVVDDYWLSHILSGKEQPGPRVLRTSELPDLTNLTPDEFDNLLKILNSSRPKLEKIIHDKFSAPCNKIASFLKNKLSHIKMECDYSCILSKYTELDEVEGFILNDEQLKNVNTLTCGPFSSIPYLKALLKGCAKLTTLDLSDFRNLTGELNLEDVVLKELESIVLPRSISSSNLQSLLKASPNLNALNLCGCDKLDGALNLDEVFLNKLESINLSNSNISSSNLQILLKASPNLKTLFLSGNHRVEGGLSLDESCLNKLESIGLPHSISSSNLQTFLKASPNLKTLGLSGCDQLHDALNLDEGCLNKLELIDLEYSNISSSNLQILLKASPNLITLDLRDCNKLDDALNLGERYLNKLEFINLQSSGILSPNLQTLLKAAPNLKTLNLNYCKQLDGALNLDEGCLNILEVINLGYSNISSSNLQTLLEASPNLKKLDLNHCDNLDGALNLGEGYLNKLVSIDSWDSSISSSSLQTLLRASPKLKSLALSRCRRLDGALNLEENCLNELESIYLNDSNISSSSLQALLKASPNLKTLSLSGCNQLNDALNLDENCLNKLESITLESSSISSADLQRLLKAAPNLKSLNLSACRKLDDTLKLDECCFNKLESIELPPSISSSNLQTLLAGAPNLQALCLNGLNGVLKLDNIHLNKLESIKSSYSDISSSNLEALLKVSPFIKTLNLRGCENLDAPLNLEKGCLDKLGAIDLINSNISSSNLQELLKASSNLETLDLLGCQQLDGPLNLEGICLKSLKTLNLGSSNISLSNLQLLLKAAPNLTNLDLGSCFNLQGALSLKENSLPMLRQGGLLFCNLSSQSLDVLLNAAPILKQNILAPLKSSPGSALSQPHSAKSSIPVNPEHDPQQMKDFKPNSEPFQFNKNNNTKNQGMIIGKLCQYLTLKQKHLDVIPKIQDGICLALSHYFCNLPQIKWDQFIEKALSWGGQEDSLEKVLSDHFDALYQYVHAYYLTPQPKRQYVGDELRSLFKSNIPHILSNPWHSIAIRPADNGGWYVYDSNYVAGYKLVNQYDLLSTIHKSIGRIVSVESDNPHHLLTIFNPNQFLAEGGLLALCSCDNAEAILSKLPKDHVYTPEALDGLLLRNTSGSPAWATGLASKNPLIAQWTQNVLEQFKRNSNDAEQRLTKSLDALSAVKKGECISTLVQSSAQAENKGLIEAVRASANQKYYDSKLKTWDKGAQSFPSALAYGHHCLSSGQKKRLIELESTTHVDSLRMQLEHLAASTHRPVFYIDKPEDLVCSAPWLKKDGNLGALQKGPGGPLYDFLQVNKDKNPLLIVNYEAFNSDDMVRFNGLLDKEPHADGISLPQQTMIIGLMNRNKPDCYQGSDFYSRFNQTERYPLTTQQFDVLKSSKQVEISPEGNQDKVIINLYHSSDWEDRLLGHWVLNGRTLHFIEGELIKAIQTGKPIEIQNGFWGDKSFERFWQLALTSGVRHAGQLIKIPEHIAIVRPQIDSYKWPVIPQIKEVAARNQDLKVLNPTRLIDFLEPYELQGDKLLKRPGLIELAKGSNKPLAIYVTRTLTEDAWAMVMDECARHDVQLEVCCAPGVELPEAFHYQVKPSIPQKGIPKEVQEDVFIASTDMDTTVFQLLKDKEHLVIDVSECTAADLLTKLDGKLNQGSLEFEFSQSDSALTQALTENKNIILKGTFSPELLDSLAPLLQARKSNKADGQIVLVTDDAHVGTFVNHCYLHQVSKEEKLDCLPPEPALIDKLASYAEAESLSKLRARYHFLKVNPTATQSDDAWLGLQSLKGNSQASIALLDKATSLSESNEFMQKRRADVNAVLDSAPYAFLSGLSGVGKSTFVEQELCTANDTLYLTEDRIQSWAEDKSDKRKILFLDEANLSPRQWSEFEGLFNTPPSILVNGRLCTLSPNHKVVFAGNPVNYGDERSLAPLFQRHGNAVLFTPLPPAVIYEKILKPAFSETGIAPEPFVDRILAIYRFICDCSTTEVLISPRELQMMALLSITYAQKHPEHNRNDIAEHFSYELAKNLVPQDKIAGFNTQFKPKNPIKKAASKAEQDPNFLLTESRQDLSQQLNDLLELREWRRVKEDGLNMAQKSGGLGGIIIEGESGIGKSELVMAELRARNYTEERDLEHPTKMDKPFYRLHVTMALDEKEKLLIKAFNEGAVVLIDEINSSPMMERLLNDLLMGKNPRGKEGDKVRPGFMVVGTQNPVTMSGRRVPSTALQRRLITTILPEYSAAEIKTILLAKGVDAHEADSMIAVYEKNREFALKNQLSPPPNFRNLMHLAEEYLHNRLQGIAKEAQPEPSVNTEHQADLANYSLEELKTFEPQALALLLKDNIKLQQQILNKLTTLDQFTQFVKVLNLESLKVFLSIMAPQIKNKMVWSSAHLSALLIPHKDPAIFKILAGHFSGRMNSLSDELIYAVSAKKFGYANLLIENGADFFHGKRSGPSFARDLNLGWDRGLISEETAPALYIQAFETTCKKSLDKIAPYIKLLKKEPLSPTKKDDEDKKRFLESIQFYPVLESLLKSRAKYEGLHNRFYSSDTNFRAVFNELDSLTKELMQARRRLSNKPFDEVMYKEFIGSCTRAIEQATPVLSQHRGTIEFRKTRNILFGFMCCLIIPAIFYGLYRLAVNYATTTHSQFQLNLLQKELDPSKYNEKMNGIRSSGLHEDNKEDKPAPMG